jgi:FkbM family methyltransferase
MNDDFFKSKYLEFYLFSGYNDYVHDFYKKFGGTFDPKIAEWLIDNVKPGWVIYDIGANMFEFTEISARMSGPNGMVFSFEPQYDLVDKYNLAKELNNYKNVSPITIFNFGLGSTNEFKKFMTNTKNLGGSTFEEKFFNYASDISKVTDWKISELEIKRADSVNLPNIVPDLIKLDIEGGEEEFWKGCPDFMKQSKNIIVEVGSYTEDWFLDEISYNKKIIDISTKEVLNRKNIKEIPFQRDVLFTRNDI